MSAPAGADGDAPGPTSALRRVGRYEILRELGRGAMGVVYRVRVAGTRRELALKVLAASRGASPSSRERFRREARLLARVRHPGVIQVHDAGEQEGLLYFVMDLVRGEELERHVQRRGGLPEIEACGIVRELALATQALHEAGIVHRDLKPENVLIDEETGRPLLTDFGLALDLALEDGERLTRTGASVGTPLYMAPEQVEARPDVDARADVWALGAILFFTLTGREPFLGDTLEALIQRILEVPAGPPSRVRSGLSAGVDAVTLRALEKRREDRYPSAGELARDLARLEKGEAPAAREVAARTALRSRALLYGPAALVMAGLLGPALALRLSSAHEEASEAEAAAAARALGEVLAARNEKSGLGFLAQARHELSEGTPAGALGSAWRGLVRRPRDPRLLAAHARALLWASAWGKRPPGALAQARDEVGRALATAPDEPGALLALGLLRFCEGDKAGAVEALGKATDPARSPEPRDLLDAGQLLAIFCNAEQAPLEVVLARRGVAALPDSERGWRNLAEALVKAGDEQGAADAYTHLIDLAPANWHAHYQRGRMRSERGAYKEALEDLRWCEQRSTGGGGLPYEIGWAEEHLGNSDEALRQYDRAAERGAGEATAWFVHYRRGRLRRARKDLDGAIADLDLAARGGHSPVYDVELAGALLEAGRLPEARETCERTLVGTPGDVEALLLLGRCHEQEGAYSRALELYQRTEPTLAPAARARVAAQRLALEQRIEVELPARRGEAERRLRAIDADLAACKAMKEDAPRRAKMAELERRFVEVRAFEEETQRLLVRRKE